MERAKKMIEDDIASLQGQLDWKVQRVNETVVSLTEYYEEIKTIKQMLKDQMKALEKLK